MAVYKSSEMCRRKIEKNNKAGAKAVAARNINTAILA